ncbi:hypothetical protein GCK72_000299 [Caenorhabditis remanei]|uniref:DUF229 domain containing protein n=1 Tax=Caenorhabditis remanei TaxID=31234 RepID=A0A6A5HQ97_CAERE|nr:hypothetical protein GCK72_000299 [Caenorhabditis remanei]KAF1768487.1 hypothetical protein GCK72_000299 [Caenorhabditis remanei]
MNVCSLPVYDYWHPKVMRYVDYDFDPTVSCDKNFVPFTRLVDGKWDVVEEKKGMNCSARCISGIDDWKLNITDWMAPGMPVSCEFLEAVCWEGSREVYGYIHSQVIPKKPTKPLKNPDAPNVFVFLFDSMSTGLAKRSFPKTLSALSSRLEAVEFPFVNKVGENSQPNGMALWFGKLIEPIMGKNYGGSDVKVDWEKEVYCRNHLNHSIFEDFQNEGFMTLQIDDWGNQMVNYPNCKGFAEAPTHHYMHPFQMVYERFGTNITKNHLKGALCREERHAVFEYFQQFVDAYKDTPKFTWMWINTVAHDHFNGFMRVDKEMAEIIDRNADMFDNSFVIFLGDHGFRIGMRRFLQTEIGSLEMNNPYLSISIPKKIRQKSQAVLEIMRQNSRKLQTHFDTRATILDILKYQPADSFNNRTLLEISGERGHSYLRRQPSLPRTCGRLPIQPEYCICQVEKVTVVDENLRNRLGILLIDHIHDLLDAANFSSMCEKFEFRETTSLLHYGHTNHSETSHNYEITVMADAPSFAQFQTILKHNKKTSQVSFGNIVRLDRYGKTGDCTNNNKYEKMCFCKGMTSVQRWWYRFEKWCMYLDDEVQDWLAIA